MARKDLPYTNYYETIVKEEKPMSKNAHELVEMIVEKKIKAEMRAYDALKAKVVGATSKMLTEMTYEEEIELEDDDLLVLSRITSELREMDYKYSLIEIQNTSGDILKHKLMVSVAHLK